jgi:AcrR family transcriptional regulator
MVRTRTPLARRRTRTTARRRRPPEQARQEILDAAERVFVESQPDQVGLKEVAREAGVSHALITHYFGTYAGLIEAALERRLRALRETTLSRLREAGALSRPGELLGLVFDAFEDPVHLRLMRWLLAANAFGLHDRGLAAIAGQVARALERQSREDQDDPRERKALERQSREDQDDPRERKALEPQPGAALVGEVELTLLTAVSAAYGYALAKHALVGALGRTPSSELDDQVRDTLAAMVHAHLRAALKRSS